MGLTVFLLEEVCPGGDERAKEWDNSLEDVVQVGM